MTCGIYCYIDKKNDRVIYVGKDSYIDKNLRHKQHFRLSCKNDQPINRVLQNNPERYAYKVLKKGYFSESLLNALEIIYIKRYGTYENRKGCGDSYGFNFTIGGDGLTGYKYSEEALEKRRGKNNPFFGKNHSNDSKEKMSKFQSSTGLYRIIIAKNSTLKNGFIWTYRYRKTKNKIKQISRVNLFDLKEKILAENLPWKIVDEKRARETCKKYGYDFEELKKYVGTKRNKEEERQLKRIRNSQAQTVTGFCRVGLNKCSSCSNGLIWIYTYIKNKKRTKISKINLIELKEAVLEKGLKWMVVDKKRAMETCKKHNYDYEKLK